MQARAVGFRLVVKPFSLEEFDPVVASAKKSGIIVSGQSERDKQILIDKGIVVEIGPEAFKTYGESKWCKVGDTIAYPKNAGKFIRLSDDPEDLVLIINDEDVVTILED